MHVRTLYCSFQSKPWVFNITLSFGLVQFINLHLHDSTSDLSKNVHFVSLLHLLFPLHAENQQEDALLQNQTQQVQRVRPAQHFLSVLMLVGNQHSDFCMTTIQLYSC